MIGSTYSFIDTAASIAGQNGNFAVGYGTGSSEGGITITMTEDKNTMTIGADGSWMHSLHAGRSGTVVVRLLKTSPVNKKLSDMYVLDTVGGATHGKNTLSIYNYVSGDAITCEGVAFAKYADVTYAKDGGEMTWSFHCGKITFILGNGNIKEFDPVLAAA